MSNVKQYFVDMSMWLKKSVKKKCYRFEKNVVRDFSPVAQFYVGVYFTIKCYITLLVVTHPRTCDGGAALNNHSRSRLIGEYVNSV